MRALCPGKLIVLLSPALLVCCPMSLPLCLAAGAPANSLDISASAPSIKNIPLNPPIELDYKTRQEVYAIRVAQITPHVELLAGDYHPSESVFGAITDKKPWWGIDGQFCRADGRHSIDGPSEESRFLINPFLLLAIEENNAWNIRGDCSPAYPRPVSLQWFARDKTAKVTYAMGEFYRQRRLDGFPPGAIEGASFYLKNLNARDFGYEFMHLADAHSANIRPIGNARMFTDSVRLLSMLHCGGSCGYPGGCNNGSPNEPDLHFSVERLAATMYCKLWKKKPASPQQDADFIFIIELK